MVKCSEKCKRSDKNKLAEFSLKFVTKQDLRLVHASFVSLLTELWRVNQNLQKKEGYLNTAIKDRTKNL